MDIELFKNKARQLISVRGNVAFEERVTEFSDGYSMTFCMMDDRRIAVSYNNEKRSWKATDLGVREER